MPPTFRVLTLPIERDELIAWLSSYSWPYHVNALLTSQGVADLIDAGHFSGQEQESFWIESGEQQIGLLRLLDLDDVDDGSPVFDLRIAPAWQGKGYGTQATRWLNTYLFEKYPHLQRIAGTTRADNTLMRKVFRRSGYVKEGHFRSAWPAADGQIHDSIYYAVLRSDWFDGKMTPVNWNDEPYDDAVFHHSLDATNKETAMQNEEHDQFSASTGQDATSMVRHNQAEQQSTVREESEPQLEVRHNRPYASDSGLDVELSIRHNRPSLADSTALDDEPQLEVRHNRPYALDASSADLDVALSIRHNRPSPAAAIEDDGEPQLEVRHNRPYALDSGSADLDVALSVRHNRPSPAAIEDEDEPQLEVRHNRPFAVDPGLDVELSVRHNRPLHGSGEEDARDDSSHE